MWLFTLCRRDGMSLMLVKKAVMAETWSATILAVGDKAAGMALAGMIGSSTAAHVHQLCILAGKLSAERRAGTAVEAAWRWAGTCGKSESIASIWNCASTAEVECPSLRNKRLEKGAHPCGSKRHWKLC